MRCYWDTNFGNNSLAAWCDRVLLQRTRDLRVYTFLAIVVLTFGILLTLWRVILLLRKRAKFSFPKSSKKRFALFAIGGLLAFLLATMFTPLGAYIVSGFLGSVATIHYTSNGVARLVYAIVGFLLMSTLCLFTHKHVQHD